MFHDAVFNSFPLVVVVAHAASTTRVGEGGERARFLQNPAGRKYRDGDRKFRSPSVFFTPEKKIIRINFIFLMPHLVFICQLGFFFAHSENPRSSPSPTRERSILTPLFPTWTSTKSLELCETCVERRAMTDLGIGPRKKEEAKDKWRLTADGKICRFGFRKYANNDKYEGEFVDNQRYGKGTLVCFNGDRYEGEWKNDLFNGNGVFTWAPYMEIGSGQMITSRRYEGGFLFGKRHGKGAYFTGDGASYIGCFQRGMYHGYGVLRKATGDTYNGEFSHGKPSGEQLIEYTNGDVYKGNMLLGVLNGKGKFMWAKGRGFYDGDWIRGRFHGEAIRVYSNGNKYMGTFRDGEIHGVGTMFYANGDQYMGDWEQGKWQGKGVISYKNGDKYQGSFYKGFYYGDG